MPKTIHGIDPYAPGGLDELFAFHRATFGDAVMEAEGDGAAAADSANEQTPRKHRMKPQNQPNPTASKPLQRQSGTAKSSPCPNQSND